MIKHINIKSKIFDTIFLIQIILNVIFSQDILSTQSMQDLYYIEQMKQLNNNNTIINNETNFDNIQIQENEIPMYGIYQQCLKINCQDTYIQCDTKECLQQEWNHANCQQNSQACQIWDELLSFEISETDLISKYFYTCLNDCPIQNDSNHFFQQFWCEASCSNAQIKDFEQVEIQNEFLSRKKKNWKLIQLDLFSMNDEDEEEYNDQSDIEYNNSKKKQQKYKTVDSNNKPNQFQQNNYYKQ